VQYLSNGVVIAGFDLSVRVSGEIAIPHPLLGIHGLKGAFLHGIPGQGSEVY
jgi:hypothetical protein